uniref:Helix-turn-helix domain protein n=1 Tax=Rhodopseudomonas palustris (strain DX-1) TaxID=652103 RepID=E6VD54_RHOPX
MILNQRSLRVAKSRLQLLLKQLSDSSFNDLKSQLAIDVKDARRRALEEEARRLESEIDAFEKLRSQSEALSDASETNILGLLPIIARIAKGLSQKQLADLLEMKEQQIQRYEKEKYAGISLSRYQDILSVLDIQLTPDWKAPSAAEQFSSLLSDLKPDLVREVRNRGWLDSYDPSSSQPSPDVFRRYLSEADNLVRSPIFHRQTASPNRLGDQAAVSLWHARVLHQSQLKTRGAGKFNIAEMRWIPELVSLSVHDDGPKRALELLRDRGIVAVIEPHLPRTNLDGAAMLLSDSTPVVALTLRYDRLDYFWFTLLHELGHVFLHFNNGLSEGFLDDLDETEGDKRETEANNFARSALISDEAWNSSPARFSKAIEPIRMFASSQKIHVAIVAGRIRKERKNYSLFSKYVGQGQVRSQLLKS